MTTLCQELKEEIIEHNRCKDEMTNAIEMLEHKVSVLEDENKKLNDENMKIAKFVKGLDREIENVCEYLMKKQDE